MSIGSSLPPISRCLQCLAAVPIFPSAPNSRSNAMSLSPHSPSDTMSSSAPFPLTPSDVMPAAGLSLREWINEAFPEHTRAIDAAVRKLPPGSFGRVLPFVGTVGILVSGPGSLVRRRYLTGLSRMTQLKWPWTSCLWELSPSSISFSSRRASSNIIRRARIFSQLSVRRPVAARGLAWRPASASIAFPSALHGPGSVRCWIGATGHWIFASSRASGPCISSRKIASPTSACVRPRPTRPQASRPSVARACTARPRARCATTSRMRMHPPRPYRQTGTRNSRGQRVKRAVRTGYGPARDTRAYALWAAAEHVRQHIGAGDFRWSACPTVFQGPVVLNLDWSRHACENTRVAHLESLAAREKEPGRHEVVFSGRHHAASPLPPAVFSSPPRTEQSLLFLYRHAASVARSSLADAVWISCGATNLGVRAGRRSRLCRQRPR
jgi:hypothetical protein